MPISDTLIFDYSVIPVAPVAVAARSAGGYWRGRFGVFRMSGGVFEVLTVVIVE
jgi:hypothetical protein